MFIQRFLIARIFSSLKFLQYTYCFLTRQQIKITRIYPTIFIGGHWMVSYLTAIVQSLFSHLPTLVLQLWPYLAVVLVFIAFVAVNGSLVVGDKTNHVPCLHLPQLLYLGLFTCLFSSPHLLLSHIFGLLRTMTTSIRWSLAFVLIVLAGAFAVQYYT